MVPAPLVRALVETVERAGVPRSVFLGAARLDEQVLQEGTRSFELRELDRFYVLAMDLTANDALGLLLAERASEASFDSFGHLLMHAPTLRHCYELAAQFGPMLFPVGTLTLHEANGVAHLRAQCASLSPRAHRFQMDMTMSGMLRLLRMFVSPVAQVDAVHFEHAEPVNTKEYRRLFGGTERFGAAFTALEFPSAWLGRQALHRSDRLFNLLLGETRRQKESLGRELTYGEKIERYVLSFPPSHIPSMSVAAEELGTSVRTLRRYLTAERTSYRQFVRDVLQRAALQLLLDSERSIEEVAHLAGYSERAAFNRAFKRWTGSTPAQYRRTSRK